MPPRICTSCDKPHLTTDWYVIDEHKHPRKGDVECAPAHEDRIRRELRSQLPHEPGQWRAGWSEWRAFAA